MRRRPEGCGASRTHHGALWGWPPCSASGRRRPDIPGGMAGVHHGTSPNSPSRLRAGIMRCDEQRKFPPLPGNRYASSGYALPDLPSHGRVPARQSERSTDRALPAGPPRSARARFPVAGHGVPGRAADAADEGPDAAYSADRQRGSITAIQLSRFKNQLSRFNLRQPPARLLAMICRNMAARAGALMVSPWRTATVRAVLLPWPPVMIPSGSGTMPPS
jgi:hypothetical protein